MEPKTQPKLDDLDRAILNRIQASVPLARRPFDILARDLGTDEDEVIKRIRRMWDLGVVRRLGPILDYQSWGMSGVLVASKVNPDDIDLARRVVGDYPEITHAYLRDHEWNLWFTVIAENESARDAIIERVKALASLSHVMKLPKKTTFKLGVKFKV